MKRLISHLFITLLLCPLALAQDKLTPSFSATKHTGEPFNETHLLGKNNVIFFGFTRCPDICPTTFGKINQAYETLTQAEQQNVQVIFISVDPTHDTPEALGAYLEAFNTNFTALAHENEDMLKHTLKAFNAYKKQTPSKQKGLTNISHSALLYFMDKHGVFYKHLPHRATPKQIATILKELYEG